MMDDPPPRLIPLSFYTVDSHSRISRETTQILTKFIGNFISNSSFSFFQNLL